ncbi:MAG: MBL fold metallo-hydrolase [Evtepia gabavorous]
MLCSHQHNDHNAAEIVTSAPAAPTLPYHQIPTFHDPEGGRLRGEHHPSAGGGQAAGGPFRGLGLSPLSRAKAELQGLDAAMVPVGGFYTIGPQEAKALLDDLRPKVFLPMHYRMGAVGLPAVGQVEDFLSLVENYVYYPTDTLSLDEGTKPQIAVLHCSV